MPSTESRISALESRLTQLEDERAIRELLARYGYHADAGRDEDYVGLFAPDGSIDIAMGAESAVFATSTRWQGAEELLAFISNPEGHHQPGFYRRSLHLQGHNITIRVDGDSAVANNYSVVLHQDAGTIRILGAGINEWHFTKAEGQWKIRQRIRREVGSEETASILQATESQPAAGELSSM